MEVETLTALRESIAHWEDAVRDPVNTRFGPAACALCMVFNNPPGSGCDGCPVYEYTGCEFCEGTPYVIFNERYEDVDGKETLEDIRDLRCLASAELEFLKSLLPEERK
jgi:hypothetical protein